MPVSHDRATPTSKPSTALVLGGGGVTGIAWELGVVAGLLDGGVDVRDADLVVGTSAGATVAAQLTTAPLDGLVAAQLADRCAEIPVELDLELMIEIFSLLADRSVSHDDRRARVGVRALAADCVPEDVRRAVVEARLPVHDWPDRPVVLTAVDVVSGEFVPFDRASGVALVDAVAASCAVPGVWPPVTIDGRRFMDGGVRSSTNADLAAGHDRVLVLTPMADGTTSGLERQVERLREAGSTVLVVSADDAALAEIGSNVLDPARRAPALHEGRRQGVAAAGAVGAIWA